MFYIFEIDLNTKYEKYELPLYVGSLTLVQSSDAWELTTQAGVLSGQ